MSCNYAEGLSEYEDKGVLGLPEVFDNPEELHNKVNLLVSWMLQSNCTVVHTGAGISTAAGVPDFRGPNGVWTLEKLGKKPSFDKSFDDTQPTTTHMALKKLIDENKIAFVVSQNIDGLHIKSGIPRNKIAELHGNMYIEQCNKCHRQFIRNTATTSVGKKKLGYSCKSSQLISKPCRGQMHDTILDWEHDLPENDLEISTLYSSLADLNLCLGTTLQIIPSGNLPMNNKKRGCRGKLVICNLQPTKKDKYADLLIHAYVDDIFEKIMEILNLQIPKYNPELDPTKFQTLTDFTLVAREVRRVKHIYQLQRKSQKKNTKRKYLEIDSP